MLGANSGKLVAWLQLCPVAIPLLLLLLLPPLLCPAVICPAIHSPWRGVARQATPCHPNSAAQLRTPGEVAASAADDLKRLRSGIGVQRQLAGPFAPASSRRPEILAARLFSAHLSLRPQNSRPQNSQRPGQIGGDQFFQVLVGIDRRLEDWGHRFYQAVPSVETGVHLNAA